MDGALNEVTNEAALEIEVDDEACTGSGNCVCWLPDVFALDDTTGLACVIDPSGAPDAEIVEVAGACPTAAIRVRRNGTPLAGW